MTTLRELIAIVITAFLLYAYFADSSVREYQQRPKEHQYPAAYQERPGH